MPFAVLLINPAEELLFRGVVQSRLDESLTTPVAIVGAALLFAGIYVPAYEPGTMPEHIGQFTAQAAVGAIIGVGYTKTDKLLVAVGIHQLYSVVVYTGLFLS